MTRLPRVSGRKIVQALSSAGFRPERQRGSHVFLKHPDGRATVVPVHGNEIIGPGLMSKTLKDCEFETEDFLKMLD